MERGCTSGLILVRALYYGLTVVSLPIPRGVRYVLLGETYSSRAGPLALALISISCAEERTSPTFDEQGAAGSAEDVVSQSEALSTPVCVGVAGSAVRLPVADAKSLPRTGVRVLLSAHSLPRSRGVQPPAPCIPHQLSPGCTIYAGNNNAISAKFFAVNPNGSIKWTYSSAAAFESSPAIGGDGTIYVGNNLGKLQAFNPSNGTLKWSYTALGAITSSPAIGTDETIYVGTLGLALTALKPDGTLKWIFPHGPIVASPAIASDGTIYIGADDQPSRL